MLQSNEARSEVSREPAAPEMLSPAESLRSLVSFIRRQFAIIIFVALLAVALGVIYLITARPSFTAEAQLLIDANKAQIFQQQPLLGDLRVDSSEVESQVEVLKSENIAAAVIKNLHLTEDPEFVGSGGGLLGTVLGFIFHPFAVDHAASEFELQRRAVDRFKSGLSIKRVGYSYVITIGFRSYDPDRAAQIANEVADAYIVDQLEAKYQATRRAGVWLQDRIKELRDQASSAERAVVSFTTKNNIVSIGDSGKTLLDQQQVAELSSQLVIARTHTADTKARLDRINSVLKSDAVDGDSFTATVTDTLKNDIVSKLRSQYLDLSAREADWTVKYGPNHLAVISLHNQLREIRKSIFEELKRLGETYKSDYEIAKQRQAEVQNELATAISKSQVTNSAQVTLHELQTTAQTYKSLYDNFLQRYMESVQQQSFPITQARLISAASKPLQKSSPKSDLVFAIASIGGLVLGIALGLFRDLSDRVFRTSDQIEAILGTSCLALVPLLTPDQMTEMPGQQKANTGLSVRKRNKSTISTIANLLISRSSEAVRSTALVSDLRGSIKSTKDRLNVFASSLKSDDEATVAPLSPSKKTSIPTAPRTILRDGKPCWAIVDAPFSRFTESLRSVKLAVDLDRTIRTNRVVGFTSSVPNEGKSTIAASLAQLMSQVNARTILVDCDLRNPTLTRELAPDATSGILEVIAGKASFEDVMWTEPSTQLSFLPAVVRSRLAHSNEILGSDLIKRLFEKLRENYDYVVVDLPPLAPIVDVRAATHLVDSFIYVIEWGRTKIDIVEHALDHAKTIHENMLGVVLNKVDMNVFGRYASHQEGYYYNKHYGRYGYTE